MKASERIKREIVKADAAKQKLLDQLNIASIRIEALQGAMVEAVSLETRLEGLAQKRNTSPVTCTGDGMDGAE